MRDSTKSLRSVFLSIVKFATKAVVFLESCCIREKKEIQFSLLVFISNREAGSQSQFNFVLDNKIYLKISVFFLNVLWTRHKGTVK